MATFPTVHRNGSSAQHLLDGYAEAYTAVLDAIKALSAAAPNGRDYYVQGDHAIGLALREHEARGEALRRVAGELLALAQAVEEQML